MNGSVVCSSDGERSSRRLAGAFLGTALLGLAAGDLAAEPLSATECLALGAEMAGMISAGVDKTLEKDPEWGRTNLSSADLARIERFLTLEDQIAFRCDGADPKAAASRVAKASTGSDGILLPARKPGRDGAMVAEFVPALTSIQASATEHLGAIAPAMPRMAIALPQLSAAVPPLPGLRQGLEPSQLVPAAPEGGNGERTDLDSALAALQTRPSEEAPAADAVPAVTGPVVPLPERNPMPAADRKSAARTPVVERKKPVVRRVQQTKPPPVVSPPSTATAFPTN